jgi:hypothetical protein
MLLASEAASEGGVQSSDPSNRREIVSVVSKGDTSSKGNLRTLRATIAA